jgi:YD repeat-containing protein
VTQKCTIVVILIAIYATATLMDAAGNVASAQPGPPQSVLYRYDNLGRIIEVKYLSAGQIRHIIQYNYDQSGNRTTVTITAPS